MHKTLGGWQFGARYLVDLQIYPLLWFLPRGRGRAPGAAAWGLCGAAVLFNLYGAVYMLGCERWRKVCCFGQAAHPLCCV